MSTTPSLVQQRQGPLRTRYQRTPAEATIHDGARTVNACNGDPFHGAVIPANHDGAPWRFGIHRAVGGDHDLPNPGDLLSAGLAACLDATLRMLADHFGVRLHSLTVEVDAQADVRGCLLIDREVPVGFQSLHCRVQLQTADPMDPEDVRGLVEAAENCCVVMQTLRRGVEVRTTLVEADARAVSHAEPAAVV